MKAVCYARESSDDTNKAPPIEEQIKRAEVYCRENNIDLIKTYQDNGYSGGNWNRPDWKQLIKDAKFHKFNLVVVWNTDRIARDTEQFLFFNRNMKESFVKIHSLTEGEINIDSVGDTAKNISIAMANEIFRKVTSEKVKRTYEGKKKEAERKGLKHFWGRKPKEYNMNKIIQLRDSGKGFRAIAKELGCSYQTIRRLLLQNTPQEIKVNSEGDLVTKSQVTE